MTWEGASPQEGESTSHKHQVPNTKCNDISPPKIIVVIAGMSLYITQVHWTITSLEQCSDCQLSLIITVWQTLHHTPPPTTTPPPQSLTKSLKQMAIFFKFSFMRPSLAVLYFLDLFNKESERIICYFIAFLLKYRRYCAT